LSHRKHHAIKRGGLDDLNGNIFCGLNTSYHPYTITQKIGKKVRRRKGKFQRFSAKPVAKPAAAVSTV
jgi:hypothetical protein